MRIPLLAYPVLLAALALGPSACKSQGDGFHRATRAATQREAGSVHVTVLAVAPWSHYVDALQPRFQLTADEARDLVIRDTRQQFESSQRGVGLGASATEDPNTTGLPQGPDPMFNSKFTALPVGIEGPDAMMEYWTANGLYQEVQIMNRVMRDAVIPQGFRPYLVRLQISLIPRRRHQPYDAYTTLSFFSPDTQSPATDSAGANTLAAVPEVSFRAADSSGISSGGTGPVVLPLLVTDNLESSLQHRSSEETTRLALSLLALPGDFAAKLSADMFAQEFQGQVAGRDLNALLTVARMSQNTLRVRIGALAESTADFAMVPRNHNVTLLLMVPDKNAAEVELVSRTTLVDTDTGEELAESTNEDVTRLLAQVGGRYGLDSVDEAGLRELFRFAQTNDQVGFRARLVEMMGADHSAVRLSQSLWIELVSLMGGSQFASGRFHLPGHGEKDDLSSSAFLDQTLVLIDYGGRQGCETVVRNAIFPEGEKVKVQANLTLESAGQNLSLPADVVSYDAEAQTVRLLFPSLAQLNLTEAGLEMGNLRIVLRAGNEPKPPLNAILIPYQPPPPPAPIPSGLPAGAVIMPPGAAPGGPNAGSVPPR